MLRKTLFWVRTRKLDIAHRSRIFIILQSAYRRFHSTESAVLVVHNDIIRAIDEGHVVALALLDLSSAFE